MPASLDVPIIDIRGTSNVEIHDTYHSWSMRARLERANGNHDNQIIWDSFTASGFVIDPALEAQTFDLMDRWLSAIEADASDRPLEETSRPMPWIGARYPARLSRVLASFLRAGRRVWVRASRSPTTPQNVSSRL